MTLIIGSTAIKHWFPDFPREPKDLDVYSCQEAPEYGQGDLAGLTWHDAFWHPVMEQFGEWAGQSWRWATPDELYTIKVSHSYWELKNGSWLKHIEDAAWLKRNGAKLIQSLHDTLYKVWEETHGKKRVSLQMDAMDFFDDAVKRIYVHDSIHDSVAYGDRPLWESVLKDGATVEMDMRKVWALPFEDQVRLFREEVYATALERFVIPSDYRCSPRGAYAKALKKTITSLTKGKSAQFIVENYATFRAPDMDYVQHHLNKKHLLVPLVEASGSDALEDNRPRRSSGEETK